MPMDTTKRISTTLTSAIKKVRKDNQTFQGRHGEALQKLAKIFGDTVDQVPSTQKHTTHTSSTPTAPTQISLAPRTHQLVTIPNTPGIILVGKKTTENTLWTQHWLANNPMRQKKQ